MIKNKVLLLGFVICSLCLVERLAMAAGGVVVDINPPGTMATIERTEDSSRDLYHHVVPLAVHRGEEVPELRVGDCVNFNAGRGRLALDVTKCDDGGGGA